jgi:hypothetical protein
MRSTSSTLNAIAVALLSVTTSLILAVPVEDSQPTGRSQPIARQDETVAYAGPKHIDFPPCTNGMHSDLYTGCNSPALSQPGDRKRKVAYWSVFDAVNPDYDDPFDPTLLDDLTHLILFSVNMSAFEDNKPLKWTHSEYKFPDNIFKIARDKGVSVSAAFGGWGYDQQYKKMNTSQDGEILGNRIAKFAMDNNLDGVSGNLRYNVQS